ncbi:hypothetical protein RHMOL_Rhmol02G0033500 [Rhododendron molle]|uniref:Uncharacterized protein n=1 Tax=Rhododendron molle TaxID=49168 RepID=A0ACC0PKV6_RHOML|nr:hypothetical protein RHMOL_Rhmol02G0033500 [Rhododendron molle]
MICVVATDNDATKIVNSVATFVRSAGYLFTSEGFVLTLIKVKVQDITLEDRKVSALEIMAEAAAKRASIEGPKPGGQKSVADPLIQMGTEHDAAKIVNNTAVFLGNAGFLYTSVTALWLYLRDKQEASLEQRKVVAMELMAQELPNPRGEKKSVALAQAHKIGIKSPLMTECARWVCLAGNMDGVLYVASKCVHEYAVSA